MSKAKPNAVAPPKQINIMGADYRVMYVDSCSDVDHDRRESLLGQIDHTSKTIRIYQDSLPIFSIWEAVMHEVVHGIVAAANLGGAKLGSESTVDTISRILLDTLIRNGWMVIDG